ncbi:LysR family transcriptional regulator [Pseudomonas abietaniphila]|uniref:DNA-binding transcriptional regulator, LysR family n=1 Tax=Pseudomonas abietaniphila TaxID=89065 RepID=A0A1G8G837_9PSED|nr:LysR family transcriptional regulator [Pseudomonas abietaniphila]SDH90564.1 DNA-binding transcriptional regulator, LysR family [Pseudomonas abietaniphila]
MDIEALQTFVQVADAGGVSPAARRLGVTKSVISRRLLRLETQLGVQLLARTTRGAALTDAGIAFREYAARIVAEIEAARDAILPAGELQGRFRIAAPISFGPTHLAPVLAQMARRHPLLNIHTNYSDRTVDLIGEGYDCAIRVGHLQNSNLIAKRVGSIYGKLVASPEYVKANGAPETPTELLDHQSLMQGTESWRFMDGDKIITVNPQGRFKADNPIALVAAAVAGLGLGYLSDSVTEEHIKNGALVPVMVRYPPLLAGIHVVRPRSRHPTRKIRVLTEMLVECLDKTPDAGHESL